MRFSGESCKLPPGFQETDELPTMKLPRERFDFSAMPERARWQLPNNARVAVYVVVCVEEWDIEKPIPREYLASPSGVVTVPNVLNWAWHEYGMRVGFWRLLDALGERQIRATAPVNGRVCRGPGEPVARAIRDADWEMIGHGYAQEPMHIVDDQRGAIRKTFETLEDYTGKAPKGWLGPGLQETFDTVDYLAEAGFKYVCDWPLDDHPLEMRTRNGPLVVMPYSFEVNDLAMLIGHNHQSQVWLDCVRDYFDRLYEEGAAQPRVMSLSVHPFIMGSPQRIGHFEAALDHVRGRPDVWFATAGEIHDWYVSNR